MKIYPNDFKKARDIEYNIFYGIMIGALLCICCCVSIIGIITYIYDNDIYDNDISSSESF